jgi:catecholate siderophore receptor
MFASTDNTVTLPSFVRLDAAAYWTVASRLRAQINVENLFDTDYHATAHSNVNITPGAPATVRVTLTTTF